MCLSRTGKSWISVLVSKWLVFQNMVCMYLHNYYTASEVPLMCSNTHAQNMTAVKLNDTFS